MEGKYVLKVENGKVIKTFLHYDGGKIKGIKITGDFFAYPEEEIDRLEAELVGTGLDRDAVMKKIDEFFRKNDVVLFGIDSESLVTCILNCVGGEG